MEVRGILASCWWVVVGTSGPVRYVSAGDYRVAQMNEGRKTGMDRGFWVSALNGRMVRSASEKIGLGGWVRC